MERTCKLVMLVDDDMTDLFIAARIIKISGFSLRLLQETSVAAALNYLRDNQSNEASLPELIFLDINMPVYNGFDFLDEFKKLNTLVNQKCKVIILSSSDNRKDIDRILNYDQVIKFITKPLSQEALDEIHL